MHIDGGVGWQGNALGAWFGKEHKNHYGRGLGNFQSLEAYD